MVITSSPDPLNDSPTYNSPPKARRTSRVHVAKAQPLQGSSPRKQTFQLDLGSELSPQKIKVTVEAGNSDTEALNFADDYAGSSPSRAPATRRRERTFTTTIPLKGLSETEAREGVRYAITPKKGRGRPRKSIEPIVAGKQRASTPRRKSTGKRRAVGDLVDGDDENDEDFSAVNRRGLSGAKSKSNAKAGGENNGTDYEDGPDKEAPKRRGRPRKSLPQQEQATSQASVQGDTQTSEKFLQGSSDEQPQDFLVDTLSTVRPATTRAKVDVVITRFNPDTETPKAPGTSRPHAIDTSRTSATRDRADSYPSPRASPNKDNYSDCEQDDAGCIVEERVLDNEVQDNVGDLPEFDTILESEGFSMISVDSVPSLREHISSPAEHSENGTDKAAWNKRIASPRQGDGNSCNDSFASNTSEAILNTRSSAHKPVNARLLPLMRVQANDSFSSISPDILEAASPVKAQTKHRDAKSATKLHEDSSSAVSKSMSSTFTSAKLHEDHLACTNLSVPGPSLRRLAGQAVSPRLLTPEESPAPTLEQEEEFSNISGENTASSSRSSSVERPSNEHVASSPPFAAPQRYTYTQRLRNQRQLNPTATQTPSIIYSSPCLPSLHPVREENVLRLPQEIHRPMLSPIVRTGRALQDILIPSSPRSRSQSLGSPFKSPLSDRRSSSILPAVEPEPMQDRLAGPLPRLNLSDHFSGDSPVRQRSFSSANQEDPFQNSIKERSPSPEQDQPYTLELPNQRASSNPRSTATYIEVDSLRSEDAMSWQAEDAPQVHEQAPSSRDNMRSLVAGRYPLERKSFHTKGTTVTNEQRWAIEREQISKQISTAGTGQVITIDSDNEAPNHHDGDEEEEEDFGLLLETINSSSPMVQERQISVDTAEKPRRSKIPSPWRQNNKHLVYSDELSGVISPAPPKLAHIANLETKATSSETATFRWKGPEDDSIDADLSEFQIPQKSNFKPRARETGHLDLSALLSASPGKQLPVLSQISQVSETQGRTDRVISRSSLSTEKTSSLSDMIQSTKSGYTPIPQKIDFNPRPSAAKPAVVLPSLFGRVSEQDKTVSYPELDSSSSTPAKALVSSSPSRTNTLLGHHRAPLSEQSPSIGSQESFISSLMSLSEKENQVIDPRTIEWTKSIQIPTNPPRLSLQPVETPSSPVKSCLRSPLKAPSATLSYAFSDLTPSKAVAFVSSSPLPSSPLQEEALSATQWSKSHWQLLDDILQTWKPSNTSPNTNSTTPNSKRRHSTRVISRLLGKTVRSQGESMVFEQWHLEAVDDFRGVVPGWEEKVVAMRLFSLILAAERRARGVTGRGKR